MKTVKDIYFHFAGYGDIYRPEDSFFGRILLNDDSSFEGIVEDYYQTNHYYVFGKITEQKKIELIRSSKRDLSIPVLYRGDIENGRYYGSTFCKTRFTEEPIGECKVAIKDPEVYREILPGETAAIEKSIGVFLKTMGEETSGLRKKYFPCDEKNNAKQ